MKICSRHPNPKSLPSGKGLTIASLQFFLCFVFWFVSFSLVLAGMLCGNMKICSRYPIPKSLFLFRRTTFKGTTKIRQNHRCGTLCLLFIISGAPKSLVFLSHRCRNRGIMPHNSDRCAMYCRKFVALVFWLCVVRTVHMEASACATRVSSTE